MRILNSKGRGDHVVDHSKRDCLTSKMNRSMGIVSPQTQIRDGVSSSLAGAPSLRRSDLAECLGSTDPLRQASY